MSINRCVHIYLSIMNRYLYVHMKRAGCRQHSFWLWRMLDSVPKLKPSQTESTQKTDLEYGPPQWVQQLLRKCWSDEMLQYLVITLTFSLKLSSVAAGWGCLTICKKPLPYTANNALCETLGSLRPTATNNRSVGLYFEGFRGTSNSEAAPALGSV